MKYHVDIYVVMRTTIEVEAGSSVSAANVARQQFDTHGPDSYRMERPEGWDAVPAVRAAPQQHEVAR
jgi:hypothetical protein